MLMVMLCPKGSLMARKRYLAIFGKQAKEIDMSNPQSLKNPRN
jgi:hypothetical protein